MIFFRISTLLCLAAIFCTAPVGAQMPFSEGETIHYAIRQFLLKAGDATLTFKGKDVINGQDVYLIVFEADGLNFYDKEEIYVDTEDFRPVQVKRNLDIWGKREQITEIYLRDQGQIKIIKTVGDETTTSVIEKKGKLENIYGFIYRYRVKGSFQTGDEMKIKLPTTNLNIVLKEVSQIKAGGKPYDAYYMESDPSKYKIWFDASQQKIPLQISGAIGMGNTVMVMTEYKEGRKVSKAMGQ